MKAAYPLRLATLDVASAVLTTAAIHYALAIGDRGDMLPFDLPTAALVYVVIFLWGKARWLIITAALAFAGRERATRWMVDPVMRQVNVTLSHFELSILLSALALIKAEGPAEGQWTWAQRRRIDQTFEKLNSIYRYMPYDARCEAETAWFVSDLSR